MTSPAGAERRIEGGPWLGPFYAWFTHKRRKATLLDAFRAGFAARSGQSAACGARVWKAVPLSGDPPAYAGYVLSCQLSAGHPGEHDAPVDDSAPAS